LRRRGAIRGSEVENPVLVNEFVAEFEWNALERGEGLVVGQDTLGAHEEQDIWLFSGRLGLREPSLEFGQKVLHAG
jgi:hypothetical protein